MLAVSGKLIGPGVQWFSTWQGGGCLTATAKCRVSGTILGRRVEGFTGHEMHYFSPGANSDWWTDGRATPILRRAVAPDAIR